MKVILQQFLPQLTHEEKLELLDALKAVIAEEISSDGPSDLSVCPYCGCPSTSKKGYLSDGSQRWLCKGCAQTFSSRTMGVLSRSKLSAQTWMIFAECMADMLTLRESARRCSVSLYTAWFMRMRVCEVMSYRLAPARTGTFQIDDTHFVKSLSGNHKRSIWFNMPRKPHRNGSDGRKKGGSRSKNRIDISCGINEFGDCFCELVSEGIASKAEAYLIVGEKIPEGSKVILDGDLSYASALKDYFIHDLRGITHTTINPKDPDTGNINMINALHSRLKKFISTFNGISTRRMQRYLDWFCWREQFRRSDVDKRSLLFTHECEGRYWRTRQLTHLELRPFVSYWDRIRYTNMTRHLHTVV